MGVDLKRAIFLDRDGVINPEIWYVDTQAFESPRTVEEFSLIPGVPEALSQFQRAGYVLFIVSNQPNYAKGKNTLDELAAIHAKMETLLREGNITITETFYCHHHPQGIVPGYSGSCACRKPSPYFLLEAARKYNIDLSDSWMIGDRETDIVCGKNAGAKTLRIGKNAKPTPSNQVRAPSLREAVDIVLRAA